MATCAESNTAHYKFLTTKTYFRKIPVCTERLQAATEKKIQGYMYVNKCFFNFSFMK